MFILCHQCNVMSPQVQNQQSSLPDQMSLDCNARSRVSFVSIFENPKRVSYFAKRRRVSCRWLKQNFERKSLEFCFLFDKTKQETRFLLPFCTIRDSKLDFIFKNTWTIKQYKISRNWAFFISFRVCQRSQEKMKSRSQFAIQKSKRADSQAQRIGENNFNSKVLRPQDFCLLYEIDPELTRAKHIFKVQSKTTFILSIY